MSLFVNKANKNLSASVLFSSMLSSFLNLILSEFAKKDVGARILISKSNFFF